MKKAFFITALVIFCVSFMYCKKTEEVQKKEVSINSSMVYGPEYTGYTQSSSSRDLVIIRFVPHRPLLKCMYGWGICRFQFLPAIFGGGETDVIEIPISSEYSGGYVNIYFSEDMSRYTPEELLLHVDEDVYSEDAYSLFEDVFKVVYGDYEYNASLGPFGGYIIEIEKI
jgi:hypothetical protein